MTMKLEQRRGLFNRRTYEIIDKEIVITSRTLTSGDTSKYQIFDISDNTVREFKRDWGSIFWALLVFLPSIPIMQDAMDLKDFYPLFAAAGFWMLSLVFVMRYFQKSYDKIIFKRWQDDLGLFVVWNNKPNKELFENFYEKLMEEIRKTKISPKLSLEQKLEIYRNHLLFLIDEDVISQVEANDIYERKKKAMEKEREREEKIKGKGEKGRVLRLVPDQA